MSRRILKRVEAFITEDCREVPELAADLHAVLALAKEADELKRRVRLARTAFFAAKTVARAGTTDIRALERLVLLLDLRKPLSRGRR